MRARALVTCRLQPPRLEPAVDEIDRGLGPSRRVRSVTNQPPRERENLGPVRRQRQSNTPSLMRNYRLEAHTTNRTQISLLALPLVLRRRGASQAHPSRCVGVGVGTRW